MALERAELAREIVTTVQRRVEAARDPLMAGAKSQTVLADAEIGAENARRISEAAKMRLASFWGGDTKFSVDMGHYGSAVMPSLSTRLSSPELALAEAEASKAAAVVGVERARAEQDPTISGGFRYFQETGEVALVVGFSIPLGFSDQNDAAISRAHAETSRLRFEVRPCGGTSSAKQTPPAHRWKSRGRRLKRLMRVFCRPPSRRWRMREKATTQAASPISTCWMHSALLCRPGYNAIQRFMPFIARVSRSPA